MFARMNPDRVMRNDRISPALRRLFAAWRQIPDSPISGLGFVRERLSDGIRYFLNAGLPYTLKRVKRG